MTVPELLTINNSKPEQSSNRAIGTKDLERSKQKNKQINQNKKKIITTNKK